MDDKIIKISEVSYVYKAHLENQNDVEALSNINIDFDEGQFIVILGRNGSGKSTFARLLNALLTPVNGTVLIKGMDTKEEGYLWEVRSTVGMVFQNPDNQIVGTVVEEDVAFGPENLGIEPAEIRIRVDQALNAVGISEFSKHAPHLLSGGQKQRVALAGILAMKPKCIILDEATSMLDPVGRREVMKVLAKLNKEDKITVIHVTHHMDEAAAADRLVIIDNGCIVLDGTPKNVFSNVAKVKELGLDVPQVTELFHELRKEGWNLPSDILTIEEAYDELGKIVLKG